MIGNSSACAFAQVHSHIIAISMISDFEGRLGSSRQHHHFLEDVITQSRETGSMRIRRYEDVAWGIRIEVQKSKVMLGAAQDVLLSVARGALTYHVTERAIVSAGTLAHVAKTPRAPEIIHNQKMSVEREWLPSRRRRRMSPTLWPSVARYADPVSPLASG